ncbi:MAG: PEGA domain-containing protein [Bryobacterales bacterium]|nr:PEGA domain-containing protein [Bryobacterales bacterium]
MSPGPAAGADANQPEWLREVQEEERRAKASRRRALWLAFLGFLVVAGAFGAMFLGLGGIDVPGITYHPQPVASSTEASERPSPAGAETEQNAPPESPAASAEPPQENEGQNESQNESQSEGSQQPEEAAPDEAHPTTPATNVTTPEIPASVRVEPSKPKGPPRPPERTAAARFMSDPPGASVTVDADSRLQCETPCSLDLTLGRHTASMRLTGYRNEIRLVELTDTGATVSVQMQRRVGMVRVSSTPSGASVSVNGEPQQGATPVTLRLIPGSYRITIEKDGHRVEKNVTVREDSAIEIEAALP